MHCNAVIELEGPLKIMWSNLLILKMKQIEKQVNGDWVRKTIKQNVYVLSDHKISGRRHFFQSYGYIFENQFSI